MASVTESTRKEPVIPAANTVTSFTISKSSTTENLQKALSHVPIKPCSDSPDPTTSEHADEDSLTRRLVILGTVLFPLLGLISAIFIASQYGMVRWLDIVMLVGGWYLTGMGITIGYHRMLTHRSFDTVPTVRRFWTAMGALAVEGSPIDWCMVHRKHHQFSDHEGDPHSPHLHDGGMLNQLKGFWHSHTGWLFNCNWSQAEREKYVPDLLDDKMLVAIDDHYVSWVTASLLIPAAIGGAAALLIPGFSFTSIAAGAGLGFLWGGLARVCVSHHITWSINSICHIFGSQDYKSSDDSRNNIFFGFVSHGEGWHNNHHAFPTSARHGLKWWQFDLSWVVIRTLEKMGLAWNVKLPSKKQLDSRILD